MAAGPKTMALDADPSQHHNTLRGRNRRAPSEARSGTNKNGDRSSDGGGSPDALLSRLKGFAAWKLAEESVAEARDLLEIAEREYLEALAASGPSS